MRFRSALLALAAGALALAAPAARAAFPEKPVTLVVPFGTGGGTDILARAIAPFIAKNLGDGAKVEVVNKPGAGGEIGFSVIADAPADGYTIGFINSPPVITIPIERQARFSFDRIDPLVNLVDDPGAFAVLADSPFKSLADLAAHARANPNTVAVGTSGAGSDDHIGLLLFQRQTGVQLIHVPFPGGGPNQKALLGKGIAVSAVNVGEAMQHLKTDAMRILGQMSATRLEPATSVPTFKEQGFDIVLSALRGIGAPKGLPADVRAKLVDAILKAVEEPEFKHKAAETYQPLRVLPPDAYAAELARATVEFQRLWKDAPWLK